jgi:hypothetical protein
LNSPHTHPQIRKSYRTLTEVTEVFSDQIKK